MSSTDSSRNRQRAWIAGTPQEIPYDVNQLVAGERIPELWDDLADTYVYLFPQTTGRPPSFKVHSSIFAASQALTIMARGLDPAEQPSSPRNFSLRLSIPSSPPLTPQNGSVEDISDGRRSRDEFLDDVVQELHLYLPVPLNSDVSNNLPILNSDDVDMLILFRNAFAFLLGQSLIATPRTPTLFSILMEIAGLLGRFGFSNFDNSTFGETAISSFACYCEELGLSDVRKSPAKILQAIILGERMRYLPLYQEGFVHAVGKLDEVKAVDPTKYKKISKVTQKRLERGYIDLENRLKPIAQKLEDFDFPSLFSGFANSTVMNEAKVIRFGNWKSACMALRKNVISYYRSRFGSWPPKANSKKNRFEVSGLNRLVLKELYQDFADLYDMLVNRESLTTRTIDMAGIELEAGGSDVEESISLALRQMMSEYDRATPPVAPPIPFDMPMLPNIRTIRRNLDPAKEAKARSKRLKSGEVNEILLGAYNHTSMKPTPFLEEFIRFERRVNHGKSTEELVDTRCGQWLFLYAVIQALPMVTIDAPEVRNTEGVEYFLCVPPRGGSPWCQNDPKTGRSWFGVAGGAGVVSLPSDVVANGVDAVYRRSHCWIMANQWADQYQMQSSVMQPEFPPPSPNYPPSVIPPLSSAESSSDRQQTPVHTPGNTTPPMMNLPVPNPGFNRPGNRSSIHIGLEALPLPAGVVPTDPPSRPVSHNPNMSFDQILGGMPKKGKK